MSITQKSVIHVPKTCLMSSAITNSVPNPARRKQMAHGSHQIRKKTSVSLAKFRENQPPKAPYYHSIDGCKYCKISFCAICSNTIPNQWHKTCSKECASKHNSQRMRDLIKEQGHSNFRRESNHTLNVHSRSGLSPISLVWNIRKSFSEECGVEQELLCRLLLSRNWASG